MKAIHFICQRDGSGGLRGVTYDKGTKLYRSGQWDVSAEQAESVVSGWLYLHAAKAGRSEFGGIVRAFHQVTEDSLGRADRIVFVLTGLPAGRGQKWRGVAHAMAHCGGVVDALLTHEVAAV